MAHVIPFHGTLYNPATVGDVRQVVAPPYDIIDGTLQKSLHDRHPNNVIRLELGYEKPGDSPSNNKYTRAAAALKEWLKSGALRRDSSRPSITTRSNTIRPIRRPAPRPSCSRASSQRWSWRNSAQGKFTHTRTRARRPKPTGSISWKPAGANFSPIISLFSDPQNVILTLIEQAIASEKPRIDFQDDVGFRQRLWSVTDKSVLDKVVRS